MIRLALGAALLVLTGTGMARADIVYSQPSDFDASNSHVGSYFSSLIDTNNSGYTAIAYDNFSLLALSSVNEAQWQGGYVNPDTPSIISAFTITFWSDAGNQPGAALLSQTIPGDANETFVGTSRGIPTCNYDTSLGTPFMALAGTQYWISIQASLGIPPEWAWHTGTGGDGRSVEVVNGLQSFSDVDLAFTLFRRACHHSRTLEFASARPGRGRPGWLRLPTAEKAGSQ